MLSAGSILEGAFGLVRQRPGAVAVWGLLYLVAVVAMSLAMRPVAQMGGNPQMMAANMQAMFGQIFLFEFGFFVLFVVLMTAAQRAVLRPAEPGFAYLRLGMDELRMFGLAFVLVILFYVGFVVAAIVVTMVVAAVGFAAGMAVAVPLAILAFLLTFAVTAWFGVRLSLAYPLTLIRGEIVMAESWRLTRGRFWPLFGAYLVIFLIVLAISIAAGLASTGSYFIDLARNMRNPEAMRQIVEGQVARQAAGIDALMVVGWLLGAVSGALTIALWGGAVATAARQLVGDGESVAETFA